GIASYILRQPAPNIIRVCCLILALFTSPQMAPAILYCLGQSVAKHCASRREVIQTPPYRLRVSEGVVARSLPLSSLPTGSNPRWRSQSPESALRSRTAQAFERQEIGRA